jgi:MFS family permease
MSELGKILDRSRWTPTHSAILASLAVGYFMWGVISSISYLLYPTYHNVFFIIAPPAATLAGDLIMPRLSDVRMGRKTTFFVTMAMYGVGSLLIVVAALLFRANIFLVAAGILLAEFGVEGEVPVALSMAAETMPLKHRDRVLVASPNFDNVGATVAAVISLVTYSLSNSYYLVAVVLGGFAAVTVGFALFVRYRLPESVRWLEVKGLKEKAEREVQKLSGSVEQVNIKSPGKVTPLWSRFLFLALIGVSQYLTYGLMGFVVADYYFTGINLDLIVLFANLGASIAGFAVLKFVREASTRKFTLMSFLGGTITIVPILLAINFLSNLTLFYGLLFLNMAFSEFAWASRTIQEPTLMPTSLRAFMIGLVRVFPITTYAISEYVTSSWTLFAFVNYNLILWAIGAAASIWWYRMGYDVNMVPLERAAQEVAT